MRAMTIILTIFTASSAAAETMRDGSTSTSAEERPRLIRTCAAVEATNAISGGGVRR